MFYSIKTFIKYLTILCACSVVFTILPHFQKKPVLAPAPTEIRYAVVKGDCLWKIAEKHLGDPFRWPEIYDLNRTVIGDNPDLIQPGQVFALPQLERRETNVSTKARSPGFKNYWDGSWMLRKL